MSRLVIRGGSGLGDSLYVQSVARHLVEQGERVEVCTDYPEVFLPLKDKIAVSGFRRGGVNRVAHYVSRKDVRGTDMFQDCCLSAGIREDVDLRLDWQVVNQALVHETTNGRRRPIVAVLLPRHPMGRKDGFGEDLLPDLRVMQNVIARLRRQGACLVQLGSGKTLHRFWGIGRDLANQTTVSDLLDVASVCDGFLGYCSFFVPLAESLKKPALFVWSKRGLKSERKFIRSITPEKVLHRGSSKALWDDADELHIMRAANAFFAQARASSAL